MQSLSSRTPAIGFQCHHDDVQFADELVRVLPSDIPHRDRLIEKAGQHLQLVSEANETMNLTRITSAREAAIKHVFDCVAPWAFFQTASRVLDAGSGGGFPGIPLSLVLPHVRFTLAESVQKKARFLEAAVDALALPNVSVVPDRAEVRALTQRPDFVTARAVAPVHKLLDLFGKTIKQGTQLLLYKGPEVDAEIAAAKFSHFQVEELTRYELPDDMGTRTIIRIWSQR